MSAQKKKIALLSNVTADLLAPKLRGTCDVYLPAGFDAWVQEVLDPSSGLYRDPVDAVVVLLDGTEARSWKSPEEADSRMGLWKSALAALAERVPVAPVFVSTVDFRENRIKSLSERVLKYEWADDWCRFVQELVAAKSNVYLFDLADAIADMGRDRFYSNKMWYMSNMPYSREGLNAVAAAIARLLASAFEPRRKIVALDLDNTLWGGVVGEDGPDGIELSDHKEGQRFHDFQRQLLEMKNRGVLLAIDSKNNPEDAEAAIQSHPAMLLRDDDFVARKINWENKAANIKAMETELNLSEGGFLFVDDNPVERETVKGLCPEVAVPDFPRDTAELLPFAESLWFDHFRPLRVLGEDLLKTRMYRNEAARKRDLEQSLNLDDYIAKLEMSADIHRMRPEELDRVAQLCGKTNQFNVTTKRYTRREIEEIAADPRNAVFVAHCSDKYGDSGLIAVLILRDLPSVPKIDTFLMSCRVMGRKLEDVILDGVAAVCASRGKLLAEFVPTPKNAPVRDLFDRLGFSLVSDVDGHKSYDLDLSGYAKKSFPAYKAIRFED